jgi:FtsH-binding integral membrane protein
LVAERSIEDYSVVDDHLHGSQHPSLCCFQMAGGLIGFFPFSSKPAKITLQVKLTLTMLCAVLRRYCAPSPQNLFDVTRC